MGTMAYAKLFQLVESVIDLVEDDRNLIRQVFEPCEAKRASLLEQEGRIPQYLYFINQGFLRLFYNEDGQEVTTNINCPPGFITSFNHFIHETVSPLQLECVTDSHLLRVNRKNLHSLYQRHPKWMEFSRIITEQSLQYNEQRTRDMLVLTAEQRYQKLLSAQPEIVQHVPLQYIASFIGIKPESLSRIRRQRFS